MQRLAHLGAIRPASTGENKRLANRTDGDGDDDLVGQLGQLAAAIRTDVCRLAKRGKDWLHRRERLRFAAGHDGQFTRRRAPRATGNRGIEIGHFLFGVTLGMVDRLICANRPHVDPGGSASDFVRHTSVKHQVRYGRAVREHGDHHVGSGHGVVRRIGHLGAALGQAFGFLRAAIPNCQRQSSLEQVVAHRLPHESGAEEGDSGC